MFSEITLKQLSKLSGFSTSTVSKALQNNGQVSDTTKQKICEVSKRINSSEITLKQLSVLSGFSISTVSKALSNSHEISDKTKEEICKLAKKFSYVPNNSAIALRNRKTRILALIVPEIASIFYSNIISKIQEKAFNKGYRILILESFFCEQRELECIRTIRDGCVDGVIMIKTTQKSSADEKFTKSLGNFMLPVVIERVDEFNSNSFENKNLAQKAFDALLAKVNRI